MEKLQKALNDARLERENALGNAPTAKSVKPLPSLILRQDPEPVHQQKPRPAQSTATSQFPALWSELTPYEPNPDHLQKQRILTLNAESGSNPFDILRTKVFLLMQRNGWKRLAITSPNKSCGKTTTACNLAVGLSRQRENRTMLFDMDMRRPGVAKLLGRRPPHGIKSMLTGEVTPQDQMLNLRGNVALSMNTSPVVDSTQLLLAQRTADTLGRIQTNFDPDMMIFDLPPMFAADDTRAFLKNVDCAMIVARAEHTKAGQLDQCEREVAEQTNVLGVVLNNCRLMDKQEEYYEEYS
jgi:Mrp family chromosome partitioning ATPase